MLVARQGELPPEAQRILLTSGLPFPDEAAESQEVLETFAEGLKELAAAEEPKATKKVSVGNAKFREKLLKVAEDFHALTNAKGESIFA